MAVGTWGAVGSGMEQRGGRGGLLVPAKLVIGRGWVLSVSVAVAPPWNFGERIATTRNGKKSNSARLEDLESNFLGSPQQLPFFPFIDTRLVRISFFVLFLLL